MKGKKILLALFMLMISIVVTVGLLQVNIINTKALSPLGTTKDNYEMVSKEFGEDFTNFIKDNSAVKVFKEDDGLVVNVKNKNIKVNTDISVGESIKGFFSGALDKVDEWTLGFENYVKKFIP